MKRGVAANHTMREHEHLQAPERPALSLTDLEAIDSGSRGQGTERRFCCPLPACEGKPRDRSHRSLSLQVATGLWHCFRCGASGLLRESWTINRTPAPIANRSQSPNGPRCQVSGELGLPTTATPRWEQQLASARELAGSDGEQYLADRSIPSGLAQSSGTLFSRKFFGRPAVIFPVRGHEGAVVAVHGRYTDHGEPRMRTSGPKQQGTFSVGERIKGGPIAVAEAPIDALSLAVLGIPALATCGTSWPEWLPSALVGAQVYLAFDADGPGDAAAMELGRTLGDVGAEWKRLRPVGVKDWNEALVAGHRLSPPMLAPVKFTRRRR